MAPWVKLLAAKPDSAFILETHMVERENGLLPLLLWPPRMGRGAHMHTHINLKCNKILFLKNNAAINSYNCPVPKRVKFLLFPSFSRTSISFNFFT